jgi:hypothetical protein
MHTITFAELRRQDLVAEAEERRLGRLANLARRCAECCPTLLTRLVSALSRAPGRAAC